MGELKSCPFCGSLNIYPWDDGTKYPKHRIVCPNCSAEGAEGHTRGHAIAAWNNRPDPALTPAQQAAEQLYEALTLAKAKIVVSGDCYRWPDVCEKINAALAKAGKP